jgi:hypothetical protein
MGDFSKLQTFGYANSYLIQIFSDNYVTLFDTREAELKPVELRLELQGQINRIDVNYNLTQLVALVSDEDYVVVNLNNFRLLLRGKGRFYWKIYD